MAKLDTMVFIAGVVTLLMPAAGAHGHVWPGIPDAEHVDEVVDEHLGHCNWRVTGKVGYLAENGLSTLGLGSGQYLATDTRYNALGVFEGGLEEIHGSKEYVVYTIVAGVSGTADWC